MSGRFFRAAGRPAMVSTSRSFSKELRHLQLYGRGNVYRGSTSSMSIAGCRRGFQRIILGEVAYCHQQPASVACLDRW